MTLLKGCVLALCSLCLTFGTTACTPAATGSGEDVEIETQQQTAGNAAIDYVTVHTADTQTAFSASEVPETYYNAAAEQGTLETLTYQTHDLSSGEAVTHSATVYLPYGYHADDESTRYNILYLQHGAYGDELTWMYEYGDDFKNMIDHMIQDGLIESLIIVMPYLDPGESWYHDTVPIFYEQELLPDLMPAVESKYHTYAETADEAGFAASRSHRTFGGFSAGGATTWQVFLNGRNYFEFFMPLSGALELGGDGSTAETDAETLAAAANNSDLLFFIFAATGTRDVAYQGLTAQINAMKSLTDTFTFTENGFDSGNLMYYTAEGNSHDYPYTYEYVYNGLPLLFEQ